MACSSGWALSGAISTVTLQMPSKVRDQRRIWRLRASTPIQGKMVAHTAMPYSTCSTIRSKR
ncbi:hypothetical protein D3C86_2073430 [compost metagenome]